MSKLKLRTSSTGNPACAIVGKRRPSKMLGNATKNTRQLARKSRATTWTKRELEHWLLHLHTICSTETRDLDSLQESLFYLYRRYGSMATLWVARVSAIVNFIARHRASLIRDGHITPTSTAEILCDPLKLALATLPITNPATGFSYRRVHNHIGKASDSPRINAA